MCFMLNLLRYIDPLPYIDLLRYIDLSADTSKCPAVCIWDIPAAGRL